MSLLHWKQVSIAKASIIYPTFPILTKALRNQIVGKIKFLFIEVFHLINEDGILELNSHHLPTLKKLMYLDLDH